MPIYEFSCIKCSTEASYFYNTYKAYEEEIKSKNVKCPMCGNDMKKKMSAPASMIKTLEKQCRGGKDDL